MQTSRGKQDLASSEKICATCGKPIKDGQAYVAIATDFKVGEEDTVDLFTKSYKWETHHSLTGPSRVKVICRPPKQEVDKEVI